MSLRTAAVQSLGLTSSVHLKSGAPCPSPALENKSSDYFAASAIQGLEVASETEDEGTPFSEIDSDRSMNSEDAMSPLKMTPILHSFNTKLLLNSVDYQGSKKHDQYHGIGSVRFYQQGVLVKSYSGSFKKGNFHGLGRVIYYSSDTQVKYFAGNFSRGKILGEGSLFFKDNSVVSGFFYHCTKDNCLVVKKTDGTREVLNGT